MVKHLKKMEEGVYVFVASLTLLIKNLVGEQKKPEAVRSLNQVKETIMNHCIGNEVFGENQYADLPGNGTQDSLTRISNEIATTITRRGTTAVAFMDVEKTFNSVWHKEHLHKMKDLGLPNHLILWTMDYLEKRKLQINHSGALSEPFQSTAGVPQGSTVSPVVISFVSKPSVT